MGTLTVPLLQNYFTGKREATARMDERRHATYVDAITYAQVVEERLDELTEDPLYRTHRPIRQTPDELMIRAKLLLVAPSGITRAFDDLTDAWKILSWNVNESGPVETYGDEAVFFAKRDDKDVIRVVEALNKLKDGLRPKRLGELPSPSPSSR
ncbi:hypothetical protein A5724_10540 [Mycobacterium sp. ACS1612]|nr:hypothetical protein A5724_10540 [Mycobacterium sp. ACS1612]